MADISISIHALPRRATSSFKYGVHFYPPFQSTPSRGGRPVSLEFLRSSVRLFQSTPSRGGRPAACGKTSDNILISIHALPRRATPEPGRYRQLQRISIHALPRRATLQNGGLIFLEMHFNPRPPAEGDWSSPAMVSLTISFQSTPSRGGRRL